MKKIIFLILISSFWTSGHSQVSQTENDNIPEVYGKQFSCGIAGMTPELRLKLYDLIRQNEVGILNNWLNSKSIVRQAYAVEGLIYLHNEKKTNLTEKQLTKINKLKKSNKKIIFCNGCSFDSQKLKIALAEYEIK